MKKQLKISEVLIDLENGLTRTKKDDFGNGSIEEKYGLTPNEIKELFRNPKLVNRRTHRVGEGLSFIIIDDTEEPFVENPLHKFGEMVALSDELDEKDKAIIVQEMEEEKEDLLLKTQREVEGSIND